MDRLPGLNEVLPAPRAPSAEARHLVFGYRGRKGTMRILGLAFLVIGLILSGVFGWGLPVDVAIARDPQAARGSILSTELNRNITINDRRPTKVRFQCEAGGTQWTGEANSFDIPPQQTGAKAFGEAEQIVVLYDPADPKANTIFVA